MGTALKIAYLTNQYPKVSHAFIRREIQALEARGFEVMRFSVRSCEAELVDADDKAEFAQTTVLLDRGLAGLLPALLTTMLLRPRRFASAARMAWRLGGRSDRGRLRYAVYLAEAARLRRLLADGCAGHLHAHFGTNSTDVAMLCRILGGPAYSFTVHGPEEFDRATVLALDEKIARSKFVAGVSSFGRSQLYRWARHRDWDRIHGAAMWARPEVP